MSPRPDEGRELWAHAAASKVRIDVTGVGVHLDAGDKAKVVRRVLLALSRFGPRVTRVRVRLTELLTPLGAVGRSCRMRASIRVDETLEVEVNNGHVDAAVSRAATRLADRVARALDAPPGADPFARAGANEPRDWRVSVGGRTGLGRPRARGVRHRRR